MPSKLCMNFNRQVGAISPTFSLFPRYIDYIHMISATELVTSLNNKEHRTNGVNNHSMPNDTSVFRAKNVHSATSVVTFRWDDHNHYNLGTPDRYRGVTFISIITN